MIVLNVTPALNLFVTFLNHPNVLLPKGATDIVLFEANEKKETIYCKHIKKWRNSVLADHGTIFAKLCRCNIAYCDM